MPRPQLSYIKITKFAADRNLNAVDLKNFILTPENIFKRTHFVTSSNKFISIVFNVDIIYDNYYTNG